MYKFNFRVNIAQRKSNRRKTASTGSTPVVHIAVKNRDTELRASCKIGGPRVEACKVQFLAVLLPTSGLCTLLIKPVTQWLEFSTYNLGINGSIQDYRAYFLLYTF